MDADSAPLMDSCRLSLGKSKCGLQVCMTGQSALASSRRPARIQLVLLEE